MLKVTITGMLEEVFVGNDAQVFKYLSELKKMQISMADKEDVTAINKLYKNGIGSYFAPSYRLEEFRQKYRSNGLKIKIEKIENEFF